MAGMKYGGGGKKGGSSKMSNVKGGKKIVKAGPIRTPFKDAVLRGKRSR